MTAGTSDVGAETALHQKNHSIDARPGTSDYASEKNVLANPILQRLFDSSANEERYQHVQNLVIVYEFHPFMKLSLVSHFFFIFLYF